MHASAGTLSTHLSKRSMALSSTSGTKSSPDGAGWQVYNDRLGDGIAPVSLVASLPGYQPLNHTDYPELPPN